MLNSEAMIVTKWTSGDTLPDTLQLQIEFEKEAFVRYLFTAWNINEVSINGQVLTYGDTTWSPENPSSNTRQRIIALPEPYLTKSMTLSLEKGTDQFLTKFQVGGCKEATKYFKDLHVVLENWIYYIGSPTSNIEAAKNSCGEGELARIDNNQKLEVLTNLTRSNSNMTYIIGEVFNVLF